MICSTGKRCEVIAKYMLETKATVRSAAGVFGVSKSTVHKDVTKVLEKENRALFEKVKELLEINKNTPQTKSIISLIDVLIDGAFIEELKDIRLKFRGSSNQRVIDVPKTLAEKKCILYLE